LLSVLIMTEVQSGLRLYRGSSMRVEEADRELREKFGITKLSSLRCPVCDTEYLDLDRCSKGGVEHVGKSR
jgi:hypothetical protein